MEGHAPRNDYKKGLSLRSRGRGRSNLSLTKWQRSVALHLLWDDSDYFSNSTKMSAEADSACWATVVQLEGV